MSRKLSINRLAHLASKLDGACEEVCTVAYNYLVNVVRVGATSDDEIRVFARREKAGS
jgi:hypothetical protein